MMFAPCLSQFSNRITCFPGEATFPSAFPFTSTSTASPSGNAFICVKVALSLISLALATAFQFVISNWDCILESQCFSWFLIFLFFFFFLSWEWHISLTDLGLVSEGLHIHSTSHQVKPVRQETKCKTLPEVNHKIQQLIEEDKY